MNTHTTHWRRVLARTLALLALPGSALAQPAAPSPDASAADKTLKLEKFEVTGSYIPAAGVSTTVPVTVIDSKSIEDTGINSSVLDLLRKTMPQFTGNANIGSSNANIGGNSTGGGSQLAFRNTQTLVLLNGRRVAYAPILASGGAQFVDVNAFPLAAIDRIEVLQDGASAIYGTDAVAGVVNIILKKDFKGFQVGGRYGFATEQGHAEERKAWIIGGAGDEGTNVTVAAEWTDTDPLFQRDRSFSNPIYGTATFAGVINVGSQFYVLKPGLNSPPAGHRTLASYVADGTYIPIASSSNLVSGLGAEQQYAFNLAQYVTLLLQNEKKIATVSFEHRWNDHATVFGSFMYSNTNTYSQLNAQPFAAAIPAGDPRNPFTDVSVTARNRLLAFPRQFFFTTDGIVGVLGLRGDVGSWHYEVGANKSNIDQTVINRNLVATAQRVAAVSSGTINMFARDQVPGSVEASNMLGAAEGIARTTLTSYDARLTGKLADLPAGELHAAVLVDYRTEMLKQDADRLSQNATFGWDSATTFNPLGKSRSVWSYMAEVNVPLFGPEQKIAGLYRLDLDAAVRHEAYNDTAEKPTVPKATLRWQPFGEEFLVRTTVGKSFIAPSLPNKFGAGGIGFTSPLGLTRYGGGTLITGQANSRGGSNPDLNPSHSKNYTVGIVWSPKRIGGLDLKGFSVSADYFHVRQTDLIAFIGNANILQSVELLGTASPYASRVRFGPTGDSTQFTQGAPVTGPGQIGGHAIDQVYVTNQLVNIAGTELSGVDFRLAYDWKSDAWGRFDFSVTGGWWQKFTVQNLPTVAPADTAGFATDQTSGNGTIPRLSTFTSVDWMRGKWRATAGWQWISSVSDLNAFSTTDPTADSHVEAFNSFDLSLAYSFGSEWRLLKGLTLRVGANNVLDAQPPQAKGSFSQSNADIATYDPMGRFLYIEGKYDF